MQRKLNLPDLLLAISLAGIVFAGLTAVYKVRLSTILPASPWARMVLFVLDGVGG